MMKMKSSKGNWTGRKGQLFLHLFLKYIYAYVNKSILKLNICVRLSVSVLLHYNFKVNVILTYVNKSILKLNICVLLSVSVSLHYNCIVMHVMLQGV